MVTENKMNKIKIFQVDAFSDTLFRGNPAAVCVLKEWTGDQLMQSIAAENNLSETAFIVPAEGHYEIRWFTPAVEVELCGHATLASAYVLFNFTGHKGKEVSFYSHFSKELKVTMDSDILYLDFPTDTLAESSNIQEIEECIGIRPAGIYKGRTDFIVLVNNENEVRNLKPDFLKIEKLDSRGLIVTARGKSADFVSRFFAPRCGINEDPVTGSAHTSLIPLWSEKLGKNKMTAFQLSKRGGRLWCENKGERCLIGGMAKLYITGELYI
jgi:PhzF family phenazine biosynthesis protein